jgi:predicted DNA-binding transcriptional regulator AlpA
MTKIITCVIGGSSQYLAMINYVQRGAVMANKFQKLPCGFFPDEGYVRLPQVLSVFPVSRSSWWAGVSAGKFPKPVKLGPRISAWRVDDIRDLIAQSGMEKMNPESSSEDVFHGDENAGS